MQIRLTTSPGETPMPPEKDQRKRQQTNHLQDILQEDREVCQFGTRCYRKSEVHLKFKKHCHSRFISDGVNICYIHYVTVEKLLPEFLKNPNNFVISSTLKTELDIEDEDKVLEQLKVLGQSISPFIITVVKL